MSSNPSESSPSKGPYFGPIIRNLQSTIVQLPAHPAFVQQRHGAPITPAARCCLWEKDVYDAGMESWFSSAQSAGWELKMGIVLVTRNKLVARLRVTRQHGQPAGLLHGGISALIAEELGSIASALNAAPKPVVGINVSATHLSGVKLGQMIIAVCTPIKGRGNLQAWKIDVHVDEEQTDESVAFSTDPLYHYNLKPKGTLAATCQLTTMAQPVKSIPNGAPSTAFPVLPKSKL